MADATAGTRAASAGADLPARPAATICHMATITDKKSIHATLTTTTVDRAQLLQFWDYVEVYNGEASGGDDVYITDDGATDPTAGAEGTRRVAPGERLMFSSRPLTTTLPDGSAVICHEIRVLGNGGSYSVEGLDAAQRTTLGLGTAATAGSASTSAEGIVELANATEVLTGTDTTRVPTPSVIAPFAAHTRVSGALAETVPRHFPASAITLTSGCLHLVAISLPADLTVTSITFVSGAGLSGLSNQWFGLFNSSRVPLRLTADDTSTAWALNSAKTLNLSSTYTTTTGGLFYLGICVVASGMGTIAGQTSTSIMTGFAPIISGSSSTGLTNPASCPNPAGSLGATSTIPFAYVS